MSIKLCHRIHLKNHAFTSGMISIAYRSPWVKEASAIHVESLENRVRNCAEVIALQITTQPCEG